MTARMEDYKKQLGIPEGQTLRRVDDKWAVRKGQDTDTDIYEQLDEAGNVVAKWEETDSTSTNPPFTRTVSHRKIG